MKGLLLISNIRQINRSETVSFITDLITLSVTALSEQDQLHSFNMTESVSELHIDHENSESESENE